MVNIATIALTHAIMLLAAWRLLVRHDLDRDPAPDPAPDPVLGETDRKPARGGRGERA